MIKQLVNGINEPLKSYVGKKVFSVKKKNERRKFLIDADRKQILDPWRMLATAGQSAGMARMLNALASTRNFLTSII